MENMDAERRVTLIDIRENITGEYYFTAQDGVRDTGHIDPEHQKALGLLTLCVLVLKNGFVVTGESSCVNPENFDAGTGKRLAYHHALEKVWPLMGYALCDRVTKA
jgi:hypothetical protein